MKKWRVLEGSGDYLTDPDGCWDVGLCGPVFTDEDAAIDWAHRRYEVRTERIRRGPNRAWWKSYWAVVVPAELTVQDAIRFARATEVA